MTGDALFEPARYDKAPALFDAELRPHAIVRDAVGLTVAACPDDIVPAWHDGPLPCAHCAAPIVWTDRNGRDSNRYVHDATDREECTR